MAIAGRRLFALPNPDATVYPRTMALGFYPVTKGLLVLAGLAALSGCEFRGPAFLGGSGNSGGGGEGGGGGEDDSFFVQEVEVIDLVRVPVLRSAEAERTAGGLIIRVEGLAPSQGFFSAVLTPLNDGTPDAAGIVGFELLAAPPEARQAIGPERTRLLLAATYLSDIELKGIRGIRVAGGLNALTLTLR